MTKDKITIKKILDKAAKHSKMDWYQKIIRKISPYFTFTFLTLGISANQVTLISLIPIITGASLFVLSNPFYWVLGWVIMQLYCVIDCSDGEVARYNNNVSNFGIAFDEFLHPIVNSIVLIAATVGLYLMYQESYVIIFGGFAVFFTLLNRIVRISFSTKKVGIGGGRLPLGGLIHAFLIPSLLDMYFSGFRLLFLLLLGLLIPLLFLRNLINSYRTLR